MLDDNWERKLRAKPRPEQVERLLRTHGPEAVAERWGYADSDRLKRRIERVAEGIYTPRPSQRDWSDMDAAVCVEASAVLRSLRGGERAAGVVSNAGMYIHASRGLPWPKTSLEMRSERVQLARRANRGDQEAQARLDALRDFERAVGRVLRKALALVPAEQQTTEGRYRLPPINDALERALAGEPERAVEAVFPGLTRRPLPAWLVEILDAWTLPERVREAA